VPVRSTQTVEKISFYFRHFSSLKAVFPSSFLIKLYHVHQHGCNKGVVFTIRCFIYFKCPYIKGLRRIVCTQVVIKCCQIVQCRGNIRMVWTKGCFIYPGLEKALPDCSALPQHWDHLGQTHSHIFQ